MKRALGAALVLAALAASAQDSPLVRAARAGKVGYRLPIGPIAPDFTVTRWWNSVPIDLHSLRGSVVLLDFWATWCAPCVAAMPKVHAIAREMRPLPFKVVLLHTPNAPYGLESATQEKTIGAFLAEKHVELPVGLVAGASVKAYNPRGYPFYVLIDKQGRIRFAENKMPPEASIRSVIVE